MLRSPARRRLLALVGTAVVLGSVSACEHGSSSVAEPPSSTPSSASSSAPTSPSTGPASGGPPTSRPGKARSVFAPILSRPHLRPGSDPSVLPGDVLIADKLNNRLIVVDPTGRIRWRFPRPGDLARGQTFRIPDDAFFTPDGRYIVATQEDDFVISLIDVARHRIVWRYGKPGVHGSGPNRLWNPDDAMVLPGGYVFSADIKNCRLILIPPHAHRLARSFGSGACGHDPPHEFASPNGAFPMRNGHFLITEINGDWVDELSLRGRLFMAVHPPGLHYPSDSNEISPGRYLSVDYWTPGQIVVFDRRGRLLWRFAPSGRDALDKPSLALPLPNGDILANDDANHRVIVVDPRRHRIVWQYGVTGRPGRSPGLLDNPDGVDLVPPHSLLVTHAATLPRP